MNRKAGGAFVGILVTAAATKALIGILGPEISTTASASSVSSDRLNGKPASSKQLDGWIRQALVVMEQQNIPGSYEGLHRNIIRESGGNPDICNDWDVNAQAGTPSCGLLQVIQPTFDEWKLPQSAYDKAGVQASANSLTDPVANLVTAANYAWHRYPGKGGIDGINSAY